MKNILIESQTHSFSDIAFFEKEKERLVWNVISERNDIIKYPDFIAKFKEKIIFYKISFFIKQLEKEDIKKFAEKIWWNVVSFSNNLSDYFDFSEYFDFSTLTTYDFPPEIINKNKERIDWSQLGIPSCWVSYLPEKFLRKSINQIINNGKALKGSVLADVSRDFILFVIKKISKMKEGTVKMLKLDSFVSFVLSNYKKLNENFVIKLTEILEKNGTHTSYVLYFLENNKNIKKEKLESWHSLMLLLKLK